MITRAAVKIKFFDTDGTRDIIITCHRHCDAFQILKEFGFYKGSDYKELAQGFLNEKGEFLTRTEAYQEAVRYHQFLDSYIEEHINDTITPTVLYSEDIW